MPTLEVPSTPATPSGPVVPSEPATPADPTPSETPDLPSGPKEFDDEGGRHVHYAFSAAPGRLDALRDRLVAYGASVRGPVEHEGGDRSIYVEDPEGTVVEVWDYFERGRAIEELA